MKGCLLLSQTESDKLIVRFFNLNEENNMNGLKACGFISTCICDLILIFSRQGGHHIKLDSTSKKPLQISYVCFLQSTMYMNHSKLMTEHGQCHGCAIFSKATFVGGTFSLWLDAPYDLIVPTILTEGKISQRCL